MVRSGSTMQLTRAADYAVRVMIHLATLPEHERALLPSLAGATGAPASFLSKVLQSLSKAELIRSHRGQSGGFEILGRGRQATLREVVEAIDGAISLNVCMISGTSCERVSFCPAHPFWKRAQGAMMEVLNSATVESMAAELSAQPPHAAEAACQA